MKKIIILLLAVSILPIQAQKKQKIKGNREVLIKKFTIPSFSELEIGEKFEVKLQKATDTTHIVIETDDNLFDVIHYEIKDGVLAFYTTMEIVKKKRLRITVFVPDHFNKVTLLEKGKVFNDEPLILKSLIIDAKDKSEAKLNLQLNDDLQINAQGKPELNLEVTASKGQIYIADNTDLSAKIKIKTLVIVINDAACKLEGDVNQLEMKAKEKAKVKAEDLQVKEVNLTAMDKSEVHIKSTGQIKMNLSGKSETYLYGSPEIKLKTFNDNAALFKR